MKILINELIHFRVVHLQIFLFTTNASSQNKIANLARDIESAQVDESNVGELLKSQGEPPTREALVAESVSEWHLRRNPRRGCRAWGARF